MTEWARLERLARQAARKWSAHGDHADLLQEARIVAWRHADEPDAVIRWRCSCRIIDCLRSWHGDRRHAVGHRTIVPLEHDIPTMGDDLPMSLQLGIAGRHAVIADGLASGERPSDIAARLNVHPSRVSQHIAQLRERL